MNHTFLLAALVLFAVAGVGLFWRARAALACVPAALLVFFANLDRIEHFKASFPGSTIEAQTRELGATLGEAKATLAQLRALTIATAESLIDLKENSHYLLTQSAGDQFVEQDAFKGKLLQMLKQTGMPEDQINDVEQSDRNTVMTFYAYAAYRYARNTLPNTSWREFDRAYYDLIKATPNGALSPDQTLQLFKTFRVEPGKFTEYIEDFRYYVKTGKQRRPDVWAHRGSWAYGELPPQ
jgi:hypothetical protein